jgi:predicted aspartyl protease
MRTRNTAVCLSLALLATSCAGSLDRTVRAEWLHEGGPPTAIPMDVLPSNHIYVPGVIAGQETELLVDTGAGITVLDNQFARKLNLKRFRAVTASGVGGTVTGSYVRVPSIRVGDLILRNVLAIAINLSPIARIVEHDIPVILGKEFFKSAVVEIDYPRSLLVCHRREGFRYKGDGRTVPLRSSSSGLKKVRCQIEDLPSAWFQLDTGSGRSVSVFQEYAARHGILEGRTPRSTRIGGGVGGFATESVASMRKFTFAGFDLHEVPANFPTPDTGAFVNKPYAGNLGGGILRRFHLWIDFDRNRMHVEAGPKIHVPFDRDRLGLVTLVRGRALVVLHASPGSPAEKAGIRRGAKLVRVDDHPGSPDQLRKLLRDASRRPDGATVRIRDAEGKDHRITLATHYKP